jgi:hypothetical protein
MIISYIILVKTRQKLGKNITNIFKKIINKN